MIEELREKDKIEDELIEELFTLCPADAREEIDKIGMGIVIKEKVLGNEEPEL